jgi:glycosyltransferase involved in cell wall biosynthesis
MAVHNGEKYLPEQIQSILDQTYQNIELIISDDASSDGSLRIANEFARRDIRIVVRQNSKTLGIQKNFLSALALAHGELVCFSDQDDLWQKNKIELLVSLIRKNPGNMLAYSDLEVCDEALITTHKSFWKVSRIKPRSGIIRELALLRNIVPGCSMLFRKEIRDRLVAVPAECSLMHDHLAFIFASSLGRIVYSKGALLKYRQHSQNTIGAFHPSVWNRKLFQEQLSREIKVLRPMLSIDLRGFECFLNVQSQTKFFSRFRFIRYSLFLRPDTLLDKLLGIFECFSPTFYQLLRRGFRADQSM